MTGEDASAFGGAIRDMWTPTCYGDPGKVTDTQYWCSTADSGGVHINSGVPNHSFALLVDGGTYNGQTITGVGLTKAAHIFWDALQMLTPVSNFVDQADALEASSSGLVGFDLPAKSSPLMIATRYCRSLLQSSYERTRISADSSQCWKTIRGALPG